MLKTAKVKSRLSDCRFGLLEARPEAHGGNIHAFARVLGVKPEEVLDFSASINPLGLSQRARQAYRSALQMVAHYPEPYAETLVQALSAYHDIEPAHILAGNGSTQLIYLLARVLPVHRVLLVSPLFGEHLAALRATGARVSSWNLRPPSFALDFEGIKRALHEEQYDALVLTNPNSPTGALLRRKQVVELIRLCRRTRTRVIVDETFIDWVEGESVKQLAARDADVIVLRSLTKFFALPGLRVGYAIASPRVIRRLRSCLEPWSVNNVAQEVGKVCVEDRRFIERSRTFMAKERAWLRAELGLIPGLQVFPSAANFLLIQIRLPHLTAARLAELLTHGRLLIRVCDNFVGLGKRFFRVAVRTRAENRCLLETLRTIIAQCASSPD